MRKLLLVFLLFLASLLGLWVLFNTLTLSSRQSNIPPVSSLPIYPDAPLRLKQALRFRTTNDSLGRRAMHDFYQWVQRSYPNLFQHPKIEWQNIGEHNWVLKWSGHLPDQPPIVFLASPEVTYPNTEQLPEWTYDPFLGKSDSNAIYGQGTQGGKAAMIALLTVLDSLVQTHPVPARTIYMAFPYPNALGSNALLQALQKTSQQTGVAPAYLLHTGGGIQQSGWASIDAPIAQIGTGQLAGADFPLLREQASTSWATAYTPSRQTLAHPNLDHPMVTRFLADLVPELAFGDRMVFANGWLLALCSSSYFQEAAWLQQQLGGQIHLYTSPDSDTACLRIYVPSQTMLPTSSALQAALAPHGFQVLAPTRQWTARHTAVVEHRSYQQLSNTCKEVFPQLLTTPTWVATPPALTTVPLPAPLYHFHPVVYTKTSWQKAQKGVSEPLPKAAYQQWLQFYHRLLANAI